VTEGGVVKTYIATVALTLPIIALVFVLVGSDSEADYP
jgi:hypothetical protein